jgi:hypothetical protein
MGRGFQATILIAIVSVVGLHRPAILGQVSFVVRHWPAAVANPWLARARTQRLLHSYVSLRARDDCTMTLLDMFGCGQDAERAVNWRVSLGSTTRLLEYQNKALNWHLPLIHPTCVCGIVVQVSISFVLVSLSFCLLVCLFWRLTIIPS